MRLRAMVLLLAAIPLVTAIAGVVWVADRTFKTLAETQMSEINAILENARRNELRNLVHFNARVVEDYFRKGAKTPQAQREALAFLRASAGDYDHFFVYDTEGLCLLDARQIENEGRNCLHDIDTQGLPVVERLIGEALGGGGFVAHRQSRPSTQKTEDMLSYAEWIPGWNWVVGTGLFPDSLPRADEAIRASTTKAFAATRDVILAMALAALLVVGAGGYLLNWHEQRKADAKLRAMAQQVVQSQEAERTRVAQELHDGVSQSLAALKFALESAVVHSGRGNDNSAVEFLRSGLQQVRGVMGDVRRISHDLRPTLLDDVGLAAAMVQTAREFTERTCIAVEGRIDPLAKIPDAVATSVFRVTQEALGNIERHAQASLVTLSLSHDRRGLTLHISDNGRGFDAAGVMQRPREGLGLTNMRERIETLGGTFSMESRPGAGGTAITAKLPLQALQA